MKYQNGRLHSVRQANGSFPFLGTDRPIDSSSSEVSRSRYDRYETPLTSPPPQTADMSKELPRSSHNRHAATFNSRVMQPMLSGSRKRLRTDSISERPAKMTRISWKSSHQLPESSPPSFSQHPTYWNSHLPLMSDSTIPQPSSPPVYNGPSDDEDEPDLPTHSFQNVSSTTMSSSPPRTPPRKHARLPSRSQNDDGADLLLFLANSPTPARVSGRGQTSSEFPPSTPPSRHTGLPPMTPTPGGGGFLNFGTPNQPFNFADFVNVTPSPAQPAWGGRTPGGAPRTPLAAKSTRKVLNFDNLVPSSMESAKNRDKEDGLLQLGEELHP